MTAPHYYRKTNRRVGPVILAMLGPADPQVRSCIFCGRAFAPGESWLKVGFPRAAYIGAHVACSARKDAELAQRKTQA